MIIYADVLIILNTYINFILLRLTAIFTKNKINRLRLFFGALAGGIYSLIILVDSMPGFVTTATKILMCFLMILIAFKQHNILSFLKSFLTFLVASFVFAGLMFAVWISLHPNAMMYNNATVYFGFDTLTLIITVSVCYTIVRGIYFLIERRSDKGSIFQIEICVCDEIIECRALLDSGNQLKDYFTSLPVISVSEEKLKKIIGADESSAHKVQTRVIPFSTIGGEGLMTVFKPDKVRIFGINYDFETTDVLIGQSKVPIKNGEFEAILPADIFK